jgi:hypothetical protein
VRFDKRRGHAGEAHPPLLGWTGYRFLFPQTLVHRASRTSLMTDPCSLLCFLVFVLAIVAVAGHALWLLAAAVFRALGKHYHQEVGSPQVD